MTTDSIDPREGRLDAMLAEILEAERLGRPVDREALFAAHPDLADGLRSFFADRDRFGRLAQPLDATRVGPLDLPDYEILDEIARGGMGAVYRARQRSLDRLVALKRLLPGPCADAERLRREAETAALLDHPNVVPIYEVGERDGVPWFAMKYVEGKSLAQVRRPEPAMAARWVAIVARAVHHAHQRGVLHRDLKPANVLLDADGTPYVTDFGLARRLQGESGLSQSGSIVGTPAYLSPEQARGEKALTVAVDVYGLGGLLYELLAGRPPHAGDDLVATMRRAVEEDPVPPRSLDASIDRDLDTICLKCLRKKPAERYASAAAVAEDLERWAKGEPILARRVGPAERLAKWARRRPTVAALVLVCVLALVAGACVLEAMRRQAETRAETERGLNDELRRRGERLGLQRDEIAGQAEALRTQRDLAERRLQTARGSLFDNQLLRAEPMWRGRPDEAAALLDDVRACPLELRDFAWALARGRCEPRRLHLPAYAPNDVHPTRDALLAVVRDTGYAAGSNIPTYVRTPAIYRCDLRTGRVQSYPHPKLASYGRPAFAPDGRRLAFVPYEGTKTITLLDVGDEVRVTTFDVPDAQEATFSPDGKLLALTGRALRVWDLAKGVARPGFGGDSDCATFSQDGKLLAVARNGGVAVWDVATGKLTAEAKVGAIALRFSGRRSIAFDGRDLHVLDAKTGQALASLPCFRFGEVRAGTVVFTERGDLVVLDADAGRVRTRIAAGFGENDSLALSHDGNTVATSNVEVGSLPGGGDAERQTIRLWDTRTGSLVASWGRQWQKVHPLPRNVLAFTADGRLVGNDHGGLAVWDLDHRFDRTAIDLGDGVLLTQGVAWSPDGAAFAAATRHAVRLFGRTGETKATLTLPQNAVRSGVAMTHAGEVVFGTDAALVVWDGKTARRSSVAEESYVKAVAAQPRGEVLAAIVRKELSYSGGQGELRLWDRATGRELPQPMHDGRPVVGRLLAFSADGRRLAVAVVRGEREGVEVYDANWRRTSAFDCGAVKDERFALGLCLSPDGERVAVAHEDGIVRVFAAGTGEPLVRTSHRVPTTGVAFSPDGRTLASSACENWQSVDGARRERVAEVKLWNALTGQERLALAPGPSGVWGLAFAPDGGALLAASGDWRDRGKDESGSPKGRPFGSAVLWRVPQDRPLVELRGHASPVRELVVSDDGTLVSRDDNGEALAWDLKTGQRLPTTAEKAKPQPTKGDPSATWGDWRAVGGRDGVVTLTEKGRQARAIRAHSFAVSSVAFAPDGKVLVTGAVDGTIEVWAIR